MLLLAACTNSQSCGSEPYYVHHDSEADLKLPGDKPNSDSPFSSVHVGAGCDNKSFILHKTIPLDD